MKNTVRRLVLLAGAGLGLGALVYGLGYRLPGFDRHPNWQEFPHLTNPHLVVVEVPRFDSIYGRRFRLPEPIKYPSDGFRFDKYYQANLRNVQSLGFQQTGNEFTWQLHLDLGNGTAPGRDSPADPPLFRPDGYEYLEVALAGSKGYCKREVYRAESALPNFYQYNYPATATDTLFIRYSGVDYRVTLR